MGAAETAQRFHRSKHIPFTQQIMPHHSKRTSFDSNVKLNSKNNETKIPWV